MGYAEFLAQHEAALVGQYFDTRFNAAQIAVAGRESLVRRQLLDGGQAEAMPGYGAEDALLWRDSKGRTELWVRSFDKSLQQNDRYERAWRDYVRLFGKTTMVTELNGRAMAIDHLYPETAAFRSGLQFVRMMAIQRRANSLIGSTTEKAAAGPKPGRAGRDRSATAFTLAKVSGYMGSLAGRHAAADVARGLYAHMRVRGYPLPPEETALAKLETDLAASLLEWFRDT